MKYLLTVETLDPSFNNNQALRAAMRADHPAVVRLLIDIVNPFISGHNVLHWACYIGRIDFVRLLLNDSRPYTNKNIFAESLFLASRSRHIEIVRLLLADERVNPADEHYNSWVVADMNHMYLKLLEVLLDDGRIDVSLDNNRLLRWSAAHGKTKIVERLLDFETVYDTPGYDLAIEEAKKHGDPIIIELLIVNWNQMKKPKAYKLRLNKMKLSPTEVMIST